MITIKNGCLILAVTTLLSACTSDIQQHDHFTEFSQTNRSTSNISRDPYRNPNQTLNFFEVKSHHAVVEIWPGAGWYSEILAPFLKENGKLYAAHFNKDSEIGFFRKMRNRFEDKMTSQSTAYENVTITTFEPPLLTQIAPNKSTDRVLTFRNVHNWMRNESEQAAFNSFFKALKPGGILGVVEHRAPETFNLNEMISSGYVSESYVKTLAKNAGFVFIDSAEINANPKDTKDHPKGVWTLPPSLRLGDVDKSKYMAIGESDRMTLKFKKPMK